MGRCRGAVLALGFVCFFSCVGTKATPVVLVLWPFGSYRAAGGLWATKL